MREPVRVISARAIPRPPVPLLPRPEVRTQLDAWLRDPDGTGRVALMGVAPHPGQKNSDIVLGAGASTLAGEVARAARRDFAEGVLWLHVGQTGCLPTLQRALAEAIGFAEQFASVAQGRARLRDMFTARQILLVLDDVYSAEQVAALDVIDEPGRLLLTVNDRDALRGVAGDRPARVVGVPPLTDAQSVALLAGQAQRDSQTWSERQRETVARLIERCERLPFAVSLAGILARAQTLPKVLDMLAEGNSDERVFQRLQPTAGLRVLDALYRSLDRSLKTQYRDLGVLPMDVPLSVHALTVLWDRDVESTAYVIRQLAEQGLLIAGPDDAYCMHELHQRYVRARDSDPEDRHDRLIESFLYDERGRPRAPTGAGLALTEDQQGYWLRNAPYHLRNAGKFDSLQALWCDVAGLCGRISSVGPMAVAEELARYLRAIGAPRDSDLGRVGEVIRMTSELLDAEPEQLPGQLLGRLAGPDGDSQGPLARILASARDYRGASWLRPVSPTLASPCGVAVATRQAHTERITAVRWFARDDGEFAVSGALDGSLLCWTSEGEVHARLRASGASGILALAIDRRNHRLAVGTQDGSIELYDLTTLRHARTLSAHQQDGAQSPVQALAVSADGARIVAGHRRGDVVLLSSESGERVHTLGTHSRAVTDLAIARDGVYAVSSSEDGSLKVWDLRAGRQVRRLWQRTRLAGSVALTPDGTHAVAVSSHGRLDIWNLTENRPRDTRRCLGGKGRTVALSDDGLWALAGAESAWLAVIDVPSRAVIGRLWSHSRGVNAVAISSDGTRAITGSDDQTVKFWHLYRNAPATRPPAHAGPVQAARVASADEFAVSVGAHGDLAIWDVTSGARRGFCAGAPVRKPLVAFTDDGRYALTSAGDHGLALWRLPAGERVAILTTRAASLLSLALTGDGAHAACAAHDGTVLAWSLAAGPEVAGPEAEPRRWQVARSWAIAVAITADGERVLTHTEAGMWIFARESGRQILAFAREQASSGAMVVTADQRYALVTSGQSVLVFDVETGERVRELVGPGGRGDPIASLALSATRVVALCGDGRLRVWDLDTGDLAHTLAGDAFGIRELLGVAGGGQYALSHSRGGTIEVWDLEAGRRAHSMRHRAQILDWVSERTSGTRLLTAAGDGRLNEWNLATGERIATFKADGPMRACALSPLGARIVAGDDLGRVHFLELITRDS